MGTYRGKNNCSSVQLAQNNEITREEKKIYIIMLIVADKCRERETKSGILRGTSVIKCDGGGNWGGRWIDMNKALS